jgi:hypothetical protein
MGKFACEFDAVGLDNICKFFQNVLVRFDAVLDATKKLSEFVCETLETMF